MWGFRSSIHYQVADSRGLDYSNSASCTHNWPGLKLKTNGSLNVEMQPTVAPKVTSSPVRPVISRGFPSSLLAAKL